MCKDFLSLPTFMCYAKTTANHELESNRMHASYLAAAIFFEVIGTIALKWSATDGEIWYGAITALAYLTSFTFLWLCLERYPLSLAYATWSGVGVALTAIAGVFLFSEKLDSIGFIGLTFIIAGIVLINGFSSLGNH